MGFRVPYSEILKVSNIIGKYMILLSLGNWVTSVEISLSSWPSWVTLTRGRIILLLIWLRVLRTGNSDICAGLVHVLIYGALFKPRLIEGRLAML